MKRRFSRFRAPVVSGAIAVLCVLVVACAGPRSSVRRDGPPDEGAVPPNIASIPDAEWRSEPLSRTGNPISYKVDGEKYYVSRERKAYKARGYASWYGKQFHGERTSSGESYDMYKMTAAHKTLPIPSFVRVTNLKNGRKVVLRVNDRGPFVDDRIIDVSYTAAVKLGMIRAGTAYVEVETLLGPEQAAPPLIARAEPSGSPLPDFTEAAVAGSGSTSLSTAPLDGPPSPTVIQIRGNTPPPDLADDLPEDDALAPPVGDSRRREPPPLQEAESELPARRTPPPLQEAETELPASPAFYGEEPEPLSEPEADTATRVISRNDEPEYEPRSAPPARGGLFLQAGAFSSRTNAEQLRTRLKRAGLALAFIFDLAADGLYRVRLGPYADELQLAEDRARLEDLGIVPRSLRE
ncbi:MAG: septal ring lytic transglycosylase RlpA family protein [Nevskiales bacterium]